MDTPSDRPLPAARSKTDLRRGQFTPNTPFPKKSLTPRRVVAITNDEQAMLFNEDADRAK